MKNKIYLAGSILLVLTATLLIFENRSENQLVKDNFHPVRSEKSVKKDRPDLAILQNDEMTMDPKLGYPPIERSVLAFQELKKRNKLSFQRIDQPKWIERGPNNVSGRTRAIAFDLNDPTRKKVWAGGIGGGLWYNDDITSPRGKWVNVGDFLSNLAISYIAIDPSNPDVIYASTGLGYTGRIRGVGVFQSTDGGSTWNLLESTSDYTFTQKVVVSEGGRVYLATSEHGLVVSDDQGATWQTLMDGFISDIEINADGDLIVAGIGEVSISEDEGASWEDITPLANGLRIELAVAPSAPKVIYAVADGGAGTTDVRWFYKTINGGTTWEQITIPKYINGDCSQSSSHFTRGQAWFDLIMAVHPTNPSVAVVGGIDLHLTSDGGKTWSPISYWTGSYCDEYVHADQHAMAFRPGYPNQAIFGTDGGIFYSGDIGTSDNPNFETRNTGYNVTTFYAVTSSNKTGSNYFLAGAQDNGTQRFTQPLLNDTREATGGDGGYCFIDEEDSNIQITSYVYNSYRLSQDGGNSFSSISSDQARGRFINPTEYDSKAKILYGAGNLNELTRIRRLDASPSPLEVVNVDLTDRQVTHIKASPYTDNRLFVGVRIFEGEGKIFVVDDAHTTPTSLDITGTYSGSHGGWISSIDVGESDDHLLATFSNYGINSVYTTADGGANWENKNGNLPDIPVRWGVFNPNNRNQVFLATELGVWKTDDITVESPIWETVNIGLANVRTDMIKVRPSDNLLYVATFGRGVFTSEIIASASNSDFQVTDIAYQNKPVQFRDASQMANGSWDWDFGDGGTSNDQSPTHTYSQLGTYTVSLSANASTPTTKNISVLPVLVPPYGRSDGGDFESNDAHFVSGVVYGEHNIWERGLPTNDLSNDDGNVWLTDLDANVGDPGRDYASAIYTPAFDLSAAGDYSLQFDLGMAVQFCNGPFALQVDYSLDGGNSWLTLGSSYDEFGSENWYGRGDNTGCSIEFDIFEDKMGWAENTDGTITAKHSLNELAGNDLVSFRIVFALASGFSDSGYEHAGVLIDNFEVNMESANANFEANQSVGYPGTPFEFFYRSHGASSYAWDFGDGGTSSDRNPTYTFDSPGTYQVSLSINDGADTKTSTVTVLPMVNLPFDISDGGDFESNLDYFHAENVSGTPIELGNSTIAGKDGTNSGSNAWVTGLTEDQYLDESEAYLYTPAINMLGVGTYVFSFHGKFKFEINWDGFIVEYTVNGGQSWLKLPTGENSNWYNRTSDPQSVFGVSVPIFSGSTNGFQEFYTDISQLAGNEQVGFRFKVLTDANTVDVGMALDDISISGPSIDAAVADFTYSGATGCDGQRVTFRSTSTGTITEMSWDFGAQADPAVGFGVGPHVVKYTGDGPSTVKLTAEGYLNGTQIKEEVGLILTSPKHTPTITRTASSGGYTLTASPGDAYQWYRDFEILEGATSQTLEVTNTDFGLYEVEVYVGSCPAKVRGLVLDVGDELQKTAVYPIPAKDILTIESGISGGKFRITDLAGRVVKAGALSGTSTMSVSDLKNGLYIVELTANGQKRLTKIKIQK